MEASGSAMASSAGHGGTLLAQILSQNASPVVMVISTPLAEAACGKNNLGFVDLLRPFCVLDRINVPVRTASENPYRLQEFQLRLFYASEIQQTPTEAAEEHLLEVVTNASDLALNELKGDPRKLEVVQQMVQAESTSSWFYRYSSAFMRTLAFSDHEAIDHPVSCLLVVSSKDDNPVNKFADLFNTDKLPALMNDGVMDPRILKHYILLHDNQDGPPDRANEILQEIRGTFGPNDCRLLCINSGTFDGSSSVEDVWSAHMPKTNDPALMKKLGCCLQDQDIDQIQDFTLDLCQKHVIPYLEQKVRMLNQQVAMTRKGLKNQIKNLWWRKKDSEIPETPAGSVYTFNSMESQIRVLADYAFMLRDYELAVSNYRLLSNDYKADKALKRYAGVMEMIGLCLCLLDQSRKEADSSLETAYMTYQICGTPLSRYATRTALWWAEVHKARGQYREAAYVLFRAATEMDKESTLRAGVLLEQSAYCYLRCVPPMLRKYGFHLVLAGIRYHVSGQRKHAVRAYMSVLSVYDGQGWNFINDHVNFHLGRISSFLGQLDVAVQHFMNLIACNHQSAPNQTMFLKEFLGAVQNLKTRQEMLRVCLPAMDSEHVYVRFEDHRTYASSAAASIPEDVWSSLEEGLVPSTAAPVTTWLDAPKASSGQKHDFNVCVAGEEITIFFELSNPLQISIEVSSMELICEFEPKLQAGDVSQTDGSSQIKDSETQSLTLSKESFSLKGGEKVETSLKVKPNEEGVLNVVGVKWVLCGIVFARYDFAIRGKRKKSKSRGGNEVDLAPHQRLKFHVVGHITRLEVSLHELPFKVNTGEVRRLVLEIQNPSHTSIKNIKLKTNHPGFLMVGEQGDLDLEFPNCLEVQTEQQSRNVGGSIFSFPQEMSLEGASTILWPLWLHARHAGEFSLKTVLYFEPAEPLTGLKYRTVRMAHSLQVIPSLEVSVQVSPCPVKLDQYLLRMDVANVHPSESFWLRQASCVADQWYFSPVRPQLLEQTGGIIGGDDNETIKAAFLSASVSPSQLLPPAQSSSFFFQLMRKNVSNSFQKLPYEESSGDVRLGPPSSKEPLINIHSGPLSYFIQQERLLQQKMDQALEIKGENDSAHQFVDVVLISEQQDDMIMEKPVALQNNFRFGAHLTCHCRVEGSLPLVWAVEGPRCLGHNFLEQPICEVPISLELRNCSKSTAVIQVETVDSNAMMDGHIASSPQVGWRSASPPPTLEGLASEAASGNVGNGNRVMPCGPYLWCGSKSVTAFELKAGASVKVPLSVAVFAAGTYDLSSYRITWNLMPETIVQAAAPASTKVKKSKLRAAPATRSGSFIVEAGGTEALDHSSSNDIRGNNVGLGHPFLLTVVQVNSR